MHITHAGKVKPEEAVEQEQIRNLYKKADGSYAAYQWYSVYLLY